MGSAAARGKGVPARTAPERDIIMRRNRSGRFRRKSSLGLLKWPNSPYRPALSENRVRRQASAPSGIGLLGRSQAVRQRILIPPFGGSIPPAPAIDFKGEFSLFGISGAKRRVPTMYPHLRAASRACARAVGGF